MDDLRSTLGEAVNDLTVSGDELERTIERVHRRKRRSRLVAAATAFCVAGAGIGIAVWAFSAAPSHPTGGSCSSGWQNPSIPSPGNGPNILAGAVALSPRYAWAVGWSENFVGGNPLPSTGRIGGGRPNGSVTPVTLQWDGTRWSGVPAPGRSIRLRLTAVAAAGPNDAWAVGGNGGYTVIEHWDGTRWSIMPSPKLVYVVNETLNGVAAAGPNDAWAVASGGLNSLRPVIEHWDGKRWALVPTQNLRAGDVGLTDVAALSPDDAWAVGGAGDQPLALHWDGTSWSQAPMPNIRWAVLTSVAAIEPDDVWAVGSVARNANGDGPLRGVIVHWDGNGWRIVGSPLLSTGTGLRSVSAGSADDVWAAGVGPGHGDQPSSELILHFDGSAWTSVVPPEPGPDPESWGDIAALGRGSSVLVGSIERPRRYVSSTAFLARSCP